MNTGATEQQRPPPSDTTLALGLLSHPVAVFTELRERPRFVFPLIAVSAGAAFLLIWYYSVVDFAWLKDFLVSSNPAFAKMPEAARDKAMTAMSQPVLITSGVLGTLIGIPVAFALQALYAMLAGQVTNVKLSFLHWFSLAAWASMGSLAGVIASSAYLLFSGTHVQIDPYALQVLSLNELIFHRTLGEPGFSLFASIGIANFISWGLAVVGVRAFSQRSWTFAAVFALLPMALLYGIWALISLRG